MSPIRPDQTVQIELKSIGENEWQAEWKDSESLDLIAKLHLKL